MKTLNKEYIYPIIFILLICILGYILKIVIKVSDTINVVETKIELLSDIMVDSSLNHIKEIELPKIKNATSEIVDSTLSKYKHRFLK